jgi:hypothetical protein
LGFMWCLFSLSRTAATNAAHHRGRVKFKHPRSAPSSECAWFGTLFLRMEFLLKDAHHIRW